MSPNVKKPREGCHLEQGLANFCGKGPYSNIFGFAGHRVSVSATLHKSSQGWYVNKHWSVSMKLHLQKHALGQMWPVGGRLLTPE